MVAIQSTLILFLIVLGLKDAFSLPMPYLLRGGIQFLCLVSGIILILQKFSPRTLKTYWAVFGYIIIGFISAFASKTPFYVMAQVISLTSILLLAVGIGSFPKGTRERTDTALFYSAIVVYSVAAITALIMIYEFPKIVFEVQYIGAQKRFRGLFPEPGMMANAAGLLIGLTSFTVRNRLLKVILLTIGIICLLLTMSRTNWIATLAALAIVIWLMFPQLRKRFIVLTITISGIALLIFLSFDLNLDQTTVNEIFRTESLETLSGRTTLWGAAINSFEHSPLIGNGFTAGTDALAHIKTTTYDGNYVNKIARLAERRGSFHNGYIQSLLDTGILGTFFYISILSLALIRVYKKRLWEQYPAHCFILFYGCILNIGKTFIYSASVLDSVLFWYIVVSCLGLKKTKISSQ